MAKPLPKNLSLPEAMDLILKDPSLGMQRAFLSQHQLLFVDAEWFNEDRKWLACYDDGLLSWLPSLLFADALATDWQVNHVPQAFLQKRYGDQAASVTRKA